MTLIWLRDCRADLPQVEEEAMVALSSEMVRYSGYEQEGLFTKLSLEDL